MTVPHIPMSWSQRRRRLAVFLRPDRWRFAAVVVLLLSGSVLSFAGPVLLEQIIDRALMPPYRADLLVQLVLLFGFLAILRFALGLGQEFEFARLTQRLTFRLRRRFLDQMLGLPLPFFTRTPAGEILTRFTRDLGDAQNITLGALPALAGSLLTLVLSSLVLTAYNPRLFLAALLIVPPAAILTRMVRRRLVEAVSDVRSASEKAATFVVETLQGMKHIRAAGAEKRRSRHFVGLQRELLTRTWRVVRLGALGTRLPDLGVSLASLAVFTYGGFLVIDGQEEVGDLVAFVLIQGRLLGPIQGLFSLWLQVERAAVGIDRVFEYLDMDVEAVEGTTRRAAPPLRGAIEFRDVTFSYQPGRPIVRNLSFKIPAGSWVGLAGPNGSGKSTVADLLFGLLSPQEGQILLDGIDTSTYSRRSVNRRMALVSPDISLFHMTLRENLLLLCPDASEAKLHEACCAAELNDLLARLTDGLDTLVGERGVRLSAGERQRVHLARVFLADPEILVLDEAHVFLDSSADRRIFNRLRERMSGRTVLVISHRPEDHEGLHQIFQLKDGCLVSASDV